MSAPADMMASSAALGSTTALSQTIGKRKRLSDAEDPSFAANMIDTDANPLGNRKSQFQRILFDVIEVLRRHDTCPSVLDHPIISAATDARLAKRNKPDDSTRTISITSQICSDAYEEIDEVTADLRSAIISITSSDTEVKLEQFRSFEILYQSLLLRQATDDPQSLQRSPSQERSLKVEETESRHSPINKNQSSQVVLTLFGGQPSAKQLFSSLRIASSVSSRQHASEGQNGDNYVLDTVLPNGISSTKIVPVHSIKSDQESKGVPFIGDLCPTPSNFSSLDPPKQSSYTTTRGPSVPWYKPSKYPVTRARPGMRESFTNQALLTGQWLSYTAIPTPSPQSSGEKRKQRDRALSTGEPHPEQTQEDHERARIFQQIHQQSKDAALFKNVYSSFAPSHDNSSSVIPQELRSRLWWYKSGQSRYQPVADLEGIDNVELEVDQYRTSKAYEHDEDVGFREAVEDFETDTTPPAFMIHTEAAEANSREDKVTEELLAEISELLETLNSYQHIRNLSLATKTQTSAGQNKPLTELSGSPTTPSSAEEAVYEMLRDQLTLMITSLPPYAVAKINGDQLENLNVSSKIKVESAYHQGLMLDDTKLVQPTPNGAVSSMIRSQGVASSRHYPFQPNVATPPHRGTYSAARHPQSSYYSIRPPSSSNNYTTYTQQPPHRQSYTQNNQTPLSTQHAQYGNGTRPVQNHNGIPAFNGSSTSPLPPRNSQYQRPNPSYQQRPPSAVVYGSAYVAPTGIGTPQQYPKSLHSPPNQRPSPGTLSQVSPQRSLQHIQLTPEEQAVLMDRQKFQLAQQNTQKRLVETPKHMNGQVASMSESVTQINT